MKAEIVDFIRGVRKMLQCHHFIFRISSFLTQEILAKKWENIIDLQYFSREKKIERKVCLDA